MRRIAMIAAFAACAGTAQAADLASTGSFKDAPIAVSTWTGFYLGVNAGGVSGLSKWSWGDLSNTTSQSNQDGPIAGGQIGYNFQLMPHIVAGVEGSLDWISAKGAGDEVPFYAPVSTDRTKFDGLLADVSARAGYADDRVFAYTKVGAAYASRKLEAFYGTGSPYNGSASVDNVGVLLGSGVELKVAPQWAVKFEYNHIDFGHQTADLGNAGTLHRYDQVVEVFKTGLNYQLSHSYEPLK